jgi:hypothetical protein
MNIEKAIFTVLEYKKFMEALPVRIKKSEKTMKDMAKEMGMSLSSFRNKRIQNRSWRLEELIQLNKVIFFDEEFEKNDRMLTEYIEIIKNLSQNAKDSRYRIELIKDESGLGLGQWFNRNQNWKLWEADEVLKVLDALK